MSPEELERLLTVLRTDGNRPVCLVALMALATGMRLSEVTSARWSDVNRQARTLRIAAATSKSKRIRSVPLNDSAIEVLDQLGTEGQSEYLFVSGKTGAHLSNIHKVWDRLRKKAELPHLRLHDLRHQYASFLVNSGRSLYEVQKILGHSSHSVTERYAHLSSKSLMDAANTASVMIKGASAAATTATAEKVVVLDVAVEEEVRAAA
jgi:integrase